MMRKTKIVCTLGPATEREGVLREMMRAGMNVARFNFSHGSHEEHGKRLEELKALRAELNLPVVPMNIRIKSAGSMTGCKLDVDGKTVIVEYAIDSLGLDDDMLVIAGDNVLDFSLTKFIAYAQAKGTSCVMRYHEPSEAKLRKCGVALVDENDLILSLEEKPQEPKSHWATPPFYYYTREDAKRVAVGIAQGCGTDAPGSYIAWLCTQAPVHSMEMPGSRYDIGNLESYRQVQATYQGITR